MNATTTSRWQRGALLAIALLLLAARKPEALFNPQFWAEDGSLFFHDALLHGFRPLFEPYNGYHNLVPRLLALVLAPVPVVHAPAAYAWAALFVGWGVCALAAS